MSALHFLRPEWLWLLTALPPLAWWLWRRADRDSPWRDAVDAHLLERLLDSRGTRTAARAWLVLPPLALAIVALAGPSWSRAEQPLWQSRAPLVVAVDLSGTMQAADVAPSRLARARAKLDVLLAERRDGEVGLLVFDQDAYVVAPLTDDAANVALFIDALSPDIMPVDIDTGEPARAGPAIERAIVLLRQAGFGHGDVLVISDHADAAAIAAATRAAAAGYRVSALGIGTEAGAAWRDVRGRIHHARLQPASLRALARAGGGGYATMAAGTADVAGLGLLDPRDARQLAGGKEHGLAWRDQGYWLLLPLLAWAAFAFRRGSALAVLLLCALLPWRPAQAAAQDWWLREDQQAHARMERGREAYRAGEFADAAEAWRPLPGADAAYNLGNALAKQGRLQEAVAAYDEALRRQPGMEDAIANRKAVLAAMQRKSPMEGGRKGDRQDGERQDGQGGGGDPRQGDTAEGGEADAAQRERMQRALQDGRASGAGAADAAGTPEEMTNAERERRLANEAWLRRVPDDPGGLLRERFRLEQLRRQREER